MSAPKKPVLALLCRGLLLAAAVLAPRGAEAARGTVIEDFESGTVVLESYPGQDQEPGAWEVTAQNTFGGSAFALRIHGNSWKKEAISPRLVDSSTVWQVAAYVERKGEMQAFGVSDGLNELLYTFAGSQLPQDVKWWTVYQGAFPTQEWYAYLLPIGADWYATYGYLPTVTYLIYVNDDDAGGGGATVFDEITDVTADLPVPPIASIQYTVESCQRLARGLYRMGIQFHGIVIDPDSDTHEFHWDFGDGTFSSDQDPAHEFLVEADYPYTVSLLVKDPDGLSGSDTCQVAVEPGEGDLPVTVNFVGDVMTARTYEQPGGIIDTAGVEAIFRPTLGIFGEAADVNVANLECSYTDQGHPHPTKSVVFRSRPENIEGIRFAGIDLVSIGNNHIVDYGEEGMRQTQDSLEALGIGYAGAGHNAYFALRPAFWTERGVRLAFLSQCNRTGREYNYQPFLDAGYDKPGFAYLLPPNLAGAIGEVRDEADAVVVLTHSGIEYEAEPPPAGGPGEADRLVEAAELAAGDPDIHFLVEPTPGDRALRRQGIDLGADVVINHHPHVLQGFEVYQGKLIAHSLGNFVFDLYYPETMPSLVLTLEIGKGGIAGYTIVPAWIDDNIPQPATGTLGREILDRVADYSRPMDALVAVDPAAGRARIYLRREDADSSVATSRATVPLAPEGSYAVSPPIELAGAGSLCGILSVSGEGWTDGEISWGREILWHGGFEEEGATFWYVNSADEWLDDAESYRGARSLALRRRAGDPGNVGTDLEKHLPCDPARRHSAAGYLKAENARDALVTADFYSSRYSSSPVKSVGLGAPFTGTADWFFRWTDLDTPGDGIYCEMRATLGAPASGTGYAWFDELKLIEWEPWVPSESGLAVPAPNNYRFLQVRTSQTTATTATVDYAEVSYGSAATAVSGPAGARNERPLLGSAPNPFSVETRIELVLPRGAAQLPVSLTIYDVRGRRVATLFEGRLPGGESRVLTWNGTDDAGRPVPAGLYFSRAQVGERRECRKLILLR